MSVEMNKEIKLNDEAVTLVSEAGEILKSRTQSIKVLVIEKDGTKYVSIQKWWRKSAEDPWLEGKGFHLSLEEASNVIAYLDFAVDAAEK